MEVEKVRLTQALSMNFTTARVNLRTISLEKHARWPVDSRKKSIPAIF